MKRMLMLAALAAFAGSGCEIFRPRPRPKPRQYPYYPPAPTFAPPGKSIRQPGSSVPQQMPMERDPERIPSPGVPTNPSGEPPVVPQPANPG